MVGTGNPLFFYIFYRFTNGILLRTRRKTKVKSRQGNAPRLASLLRCPPGAQRLPPPPSSGTAGLRGANVDGSGRASRGSGGRRKRGVSHLPLPSCQSAFGTGATTSASPEKAQKRGAAFRRGMRTLGQGCFWRAVGATKSLRCALLRASISSGPFPKHDLFLSILAFWSFSCSG